MYIKNNKLVGLDNRMVPFQATKNHSGKLSGGKPKHLVMHYTSGGTASGAISWFKNKNARASAHLVIDHDGSITQMIPFDTIGWHAGKSEWRGKKGVNSSSIGIEVVNWGKLNRAGNNGWASRTGKHIPNHKVILDEHRHFPGQEHGWEVFEQTQMDATVRAAQAIVSHFKMEPWDLIGHEDVSRTRKIDPGPAFDMDQFRGQVFGMKDDEWDDYRYQVRETNGLNLRVEPNISKKPIKLLPNNTLVHVIEKTGTWWLVAEIIAGESDVTGYVHSKFLQPA